MTRRWALRLCFTSTAVLMTLTAWHKWETRPEPIRRHQPIVVDQPTRTPLPYNSPISVH